MSNQLPGVVPQESTLVLLKRETIIHHSAKCKKKQLYSITLIIKWLHDVWCLHLGIEWHMQQTFSCSRWIQRSQRQSQSSDHTVPQLFWSVVQQEGRGLKVWGKTSFIHLKKSYPACNLHHSGTRTPDMKRWFREGEVFHHARNFFPRSRLVLQVGVNLVVPIPVRYRFRKTDSWGHFLAVAQPRQPNLFWIEVIGTAHKHGRVL